MSDSSALLARLERIDVSADLLCEAVRAYSASVARGSPEPLATLILGCVAARGICENRADIVLAAKIRILSLAVLVRDRALDEWVKDGGPNGMVLFHSSLFHAAASEPLILLGNDEIGFDPVSVRVRILEMADVKGCG